VGAVHNVRDGVRLPTSAPGFAAAAILTVAIGRGATTAALQPHLRRGGLADALLEAAPRSGDAAGGAAISRNRHIH
jgi:hypothetical protein